MAKYGKGQSTADLGVAVELLFERNLLPRLPPMAMLVSNDFRTERLYTEEIDMLLKQHQVRGPVSIGCQGVLFSDRGVDAACRANMLCEK